MLKVILSESTSTGTAFKRATTPAVAKKENVGTITSSPGFISIAIKARSNASVPEETPNECLQPIYADIACSIFSTSGPRIKYCDSAVRINAASISFLMVLYCAFRSNNGTFMILPRLLSRFQVYISCWILRRMHIRLCRIQVCCLPRSTIL